MNGGKTERKQRGEANEDRLDGVKRRGIVVK